MHKILKLLEGKKTYIGAALIAAGSALLAPILAIPAGVGYGLVLAGSALGGAGLFDKVRRSVVK